jgi:hypothetical protein
MFWFKIIPWVSRPSSISLPENHLQGNECHVVLMTYDCFLQLLTAELVLLLAVDTSCAI